MAVTQQACGSIDYRAGNLVYEGTSGGSGSGLNYPMAVGSIAQTSGKWYAEFLCLKASGESVVEGGPGVAGLDGYPMSGWNAIGIQGSNAMYVRRGELRGMGQDTSGYPTFGEYDIISVAMDLDNLKCYWAKNNVWITIGGNPGDPTSGCVYPTSIVNYKDKIRIYSSASVGEHAQLRSDPDTRQGSIFMHELRKDGFIYLEPPGGTGEINTKWILWNSGELSLSLIHI